MGHGPWWWNNFGSSLHLQSRTGRSMLACSCPHVCRLSDGKSKGWLSSTEIPCAWVLPSKTGKVQYEEICNISFMQKKSVTCPPLPSIPVRTEEEYMEFFQKLYECDVQEESTKGTAILSVIEGHSHRYTPKTLQLNLPEPLSNLY